MRPYLVLGFPLAKEDKIDKISLSIPCLVCHRRRNFCVKPEKHVLTPFGYIDIMFPSAMASQESVPYEIKWWVISIPG